MNVCFRETRQSATGSAHYYTGEIRDDARLADLPAPRPMKIELVINDKTAKALRLTILQSLPRRGPYFRRTRPKNGYLGSL